METTQLEQEDDGITPVRMFKDQVTDLNFHLADVPCFREKLVEYTAGLAAVVYKWGNWITCGASDKPDEVAIRSDTDATMCRKYLLAVRQLAATLEYLAVISDHFESVRPDRSHPLPDAMLGGVHGGTKSLATMILSEQQKVVPLVECRLKAASVPGRWQ
jgi:hypothetical protein